MAAYNLEIRFRAPREQRPDPGDHQHCTYYSFQSSKAPFLSSTPRNALCGLKIWTENVYNPDIHSNIPNCTALRSKTPRFPFDAFSQEDLEEMLCRCGYPNPCECPSTVKLEVIPENICQGKIPVRLFKGAPPRSCFGAGLSAPSKKDRGFQILPDGCCKRILEELNETCPPFYNARVNEFTRFYHGCKWSRWTSQRTQKSLEVRPGPADYTIMSEPTQSQKCAEKVRQYRRKTAKLLRYIDIIQQTAIREGRPGPASYSPQLPKCSEFLTSVGPKSKRFFVSKYEVTPGPADYSVPRDLDLAPDPEFRCHAKLPDPPFFGVKATRFKRLISKGPGPASYDARYDPKNIYHTKAPFGVSASRFKSSTLIEDFLDDEDLSEEHKVKQLDDKVTECPHLSWMFRSSTVRMRPIEKCDKRVPASQPQPHLKMRRSHKKQYMSPFNSSEARFQPWHDWLPCYNKLDAPGPGYYCLDKPRCLPAVNGPVFRAPRLHRFKSSEIPGPSDYIIDRDVNTSTRTFNERLKNNMDKKLKFHWEKPHDPVKLTYEQQEQLLFQKAIDQLEVEDHALDGELIPKNKKSIDESKAKQPKLLRCFLYKKQIPHYF